MSLAIISQDTILGHAVRLTHEAQQRVWITSPWITRGAVSRLLDDLIPKVRAGEIELRIVYRFKEPHDLEITDLDQLGRLQEAGCQLRYSSRLHAKLLLVDDRAAIVSSSNLTATAGYGLEDQAGHRNEELGVLLEDEASALADLEREFLTIWESGSTIGPDTLGIVVGAPTASDFSFAAIRSVNVGSYATVPAEGGLAIGRISAVTAHNLTMPPLDANAGSLPTYQTKRRSRDATDLQTIFSNASKEHALLVARSTIDPSATFNLVDVEVLKQLSGERLHAPTRPVPPGGDVTRTSADVLGKLLGDGDVPFGSVLHHPEAPVCLAGHEILSKHLAVLGMTGAGKSNAVKVLVRNILSLPSSRHLRVVVIDTHGEYVAVASDLAAQAKTLDVEQRDSVLDEDVVKELLRLKKKDDGLMQRLHAVADKVGNDAGLTQFAEVVAAEAELGGTVEASMGRLCKVIDERGDLCLWPEDTLRIVDADGGATETLETPGLYILDLQHTDGLEERAEKTAAVLDHVFQVNRESQGAFPTLVVLDEAQNYAPEQQTGWLSRVRPAFDAVFRIASEGRKFGVGLVVSSQRPARVNKDILSQCNTHIIFRVANVEDLGAIAGSFEAASRPLLAELPGFDTGVCVVGGTAVGMVTRVEVPLFGR